MACFIIKERHAVWVDFTYQIEARSAEDAIYKHFNGESDGVEVNMGDYVARVSDGNSSSTAIDLLDPTNIDSTRGEGWMLSEPEDGWPEILVCDDEIASAFATNAEAERFIRECAAAGSELHCRAIAMIESADELGSLAIAKPENSSTEQ